MPSSTTNTEPAASSEYVRVRLKDHPRAIAALLKLAVGESETGVRFKALRLSPKGVHATYQLENGDRCRTYLPLGDGASVVMNSADLDQLALPDPPRFTGFKLHRLAIFLGILERLAWAYAMFCPPRISAPLSIPFTPFEIPADVLDIFCVPIRTLQDSSARSTRKVVTLSFAMTLAECMAVWSYCAEHLSTWHVTLAYLACTVVLGSSVRVYLRWRAQKERLANLANAIWKALSDSEAEEL